jgi:hypothetical protein
MTTGRHFRALAALAALALPLVVVVCVALVVDSAAHAGSVGTGCVGAYGWPFRPFHEQHPVRANFGDPRTRFAGPRSNDALVSGEGTFSFHQGVDISAPDGSPVYAVADGRVVRARGGRVTVECGNGRSFQYWHIEPVARVGQHAVAGKTLLGFIQPKREHVHLTHLEPSRAVNPLAPGHLAPYRDGTRPRVLGISARGRLHFVVRAIDLPALPVPGRWHGFPVSPALVTWRQERVGRVVRSGVAHDVRRRVPKNDAFWSSYAPGTHQNWPIFAGRKLRGVPGVYLFRLTLAPRVGGGECTLVVTVADTAGNRSSRRVALDLSGS